MLYVETNKFPTSLRAVKDGAAIHSLNQKPFPHVIASGWKPRGNPYHYAPASKHVVSSGLLPALRARSQWRGEGISRE